MAVRQTGIAALALVAAAGMADAAPAGWKTYTDAKAGWSIAYPANLVVDAGYKFPYPETPGVSFAVPQSYTQGTNLNEAWLSVETVPGTNCKPDKFADGPEDIRTLKADGRTYITATASDSGMMQQRNSTLFVVSGTCTAVRYFVHSTERSVMDPPPKQFDEAKLTRLFDRMRATLTLKK